MPKPANLRDDPGESLPVKPVDYLILLALATGDRHGYAIARDIEERSDGTIVVEAGNLYRTIRRLLDDGLLAESAQRPAPDLDDDRRRYYALSQYGRQVLAAETRRLRALVRLAESRRVIRPETN